MSIPFGQTVMASDFFNRDVPHIKKKLGEIEERMAEANHLKQRELALMERQIELMERAERRANRNRG